MPKSKISTKAKAKPAAKPEKGSKLASFKKAILGIGKKNVQKTKGAKPSAKAAAPAKSSKHAAPAKAAKSSKTAAPALAKSAKSAKAAHRQLQRLKPIPQKVPRPAVAAAPTGKVPPSPKAAAAAASALKALRKRHSAKKSFDGARRCSSSHRGHSRGSRSERRKPFVAKSPAKVCRRRADIAVFTTSKIGKKIKRKELILKEKKLNSYIEELVAKYPDKYIDAIRQDLANDKDFAKVIYDLDLDEGRR